MIIETTANALLNNVLTLSRISKLNERNKSILIDANEEYIKMCSSSSEFFGESYLDGGVIEPGQSLVPLSLVPVLSNLADKVITAEIDLDKVILRYNKRNRVTIKQITGAITDVSRRDYEPHWMGTDLSRLKHMKYASDDGLDLNLLWFYGQALITTNKIKVAVYKPGLDMGDFQMAILSETLSYLPKDNMDIAFDKQIWLGSKRVNVSTPKVERKMPQPLIELANNQEFIDYGIVDLKELVRAVAISRRFTNDQNLAINVSLSKDFVAISSANQQGDDDLELEVVESDLVDNKQFRINAVYLGEAVENCIGPQVKLGLKSYGATTLTYIVDADITHYIINLF